MISFKAMSSICKHKLKTRKSDREYPKCDKGFHIHDCCLELCPAIIDGGDVNV